MPKLSRIVYSWLVLLQISAVAGVVQEGRPYVKCSEQRASGDKLSSL